MFGQLMKETLRLKPSAPSLGREVTRDITIHHRTQPRPILPAPPSKATQTIHHKSTEGKDWFLPKGTKAAWSPYIVMHHPDNWSDPGTPIFHQKSEMAFRSKALFVVLLGRNVQPGPGAVEGGGGQMAGPDDLCALRRRSTLVHWRRDGAQGDQDGYALGALQKPGLGLPTAHAYRTHTHTYDDEVAAMVGQRFRLQLVPGHQAEAEFATTLRARYGMRMTVHTRTISA
jgi:hypothetical protein